MEDDQLAALQLENARLISLLESHGIEWRLPPPPANPTPEPEPSRFTTGEKVALFRRLFRGRTDVYPARWESKTTGKSGYSPVRANEWRVHWSSHSVGGEIRVAFRWRHANVSKHFLVSVAR